MKNGIDLFEHNYATGGTTTKTFQEIFDELASQKGYPSKSISASEYRELLNKAHKIKYGKSFASGGTTTSKYVTTKDGVKVIKGTNDYKGHIFYDENGGMYECLGYFPKLDDCKYLNLQTRKEVVGCMDGFYFSNPTGYFACGGGVDGDTIADRYGRLTEREAKRLDELQNKVKINEQTESEDAEYDRLVHKYRGWDYKGYDKYAKGSNVRVDMYSKFDLNKSGNFFATINNKNYEIIYRDDKTQMYDLFENDKKIKSSKSVRDLMQFPKNYAKGSTIEGGGVDTELKEALGIADGGGVFTQDFFDKYELVKETYSTKKNPNADELAKSRKKELQQQGFLVKMKKVSFEDLARSVGYFIIAVKRKNETFAKGSTVGGGVKYAKGGRSDFRNYYYLVVDLDERGEYMASVYDAKDHQVWDCDTELVSELIEDGFLKNKPDEDLERLSKYLSDNGKIRKGAEIISEDEYNEIRDEDDLLEFSIPTWALSSLINGDDSGLEDDDIKKLNDFVDGVVKEHGNAFFMLPSNDEELEPHFTNRNDIDNMGSDVVALYLRPNETFEKGGGVTFEKYKNKEIMFSPDFNTYFTNDEEFESLEKAKKYIDNGSKPSANTINAYRHGAFAKGGMAKGSSITKKTSGGHYENPFLKAIFGV